MDLKGWKAFLRDLKPTLRMSNKGSSGKVISFDFGKGFVKAAYLNRRGKTFDLLAFDMAKLSSPAASRAETISFVKAFMQKNRIEDKGVYLTVSDPDSMAIKVLTLPALSYEETMEAVKWQLKDDIPFDVGNAIINWEVVKEQVDEGVKKNDLVCVAAKREFIDACSSIAAEYGLSLLDISTPWVNYGNILTSFHGAPQISAVLDIGSNEAIICIYRNNIPYFLRSLAFSSDKVTQSLTGALISEKGRIQLSAEQAEDLKREVGIPGDEQAILKYDIKGIQVISFLRPLLEGLAREIKLSFNYFSSNFKEDQPAALFITGGGANLKNLDNYLGKELDLKIEKLPFPAALNPGAVDKDLLSQGQNQITGVIGAVMPAAHAISLLPQEIRAKETEVVQRAFLRGTSIVVGAVLLFSWLVLGVQVRDYRKRLSNANIHLQTIQKIKVLKEDIGVIEAFVNRLHNGKVPAYGLLKQLSNVIPGNVFLSQLTLDQAKHVLSLTGEISATGSAVESVLTDFMEMMERTPFFRETALVSSEDTGSAQKFDIKCDLAY